MMTPDERWEKGVAHHALSLKIESHIEKIQEKEDYGIKFGGDGELGEIILYMLDDYFEEKTQDIGSLY
jgi:hypothetical protein